MERRIQNTDYQKFFMLAGKHSGNQYENTDIQYFLYYVHPSAY